MSSFIPSAPLSSAPATVANDGWYPDLAVEEFHSETGQGKTFDPSRIVAVLLAAVIEINASLKDWRAAQTAPSLAEIAAPTYGGVSEKVILYRTAVFTRARAQLLGNTRDYDSTKDGHDRAEKLEATADDYLRQSNEALSRLTGRPRTIVELI
jgi:hypothetical protein